ncbi:hypothetical protein GCM10008967_40170 [Bacillus carboniphilus]|uniref:Uncharacterized protein n=1 Tax=Bacillus carboniphilus TaxID=86663 RepID=A0ABN0WT64_9BACI
MKAYKKWLYLLVFAFIFTFTSFYIELNSKTEESFTYFPPDPAARYNSGYTTLTLGNKSDDGPYQLTWKSQSALDQKAIYRQDVSLLYEGGLLKGKMAEWKQNVSNLMQESTLFFQDSQLIQAVGFHFSEIHRGEKIGGAQKLSGDFIYVIDSKFSPFKSFRHPENEEDEKWKHTLDQVTKDRLTKSWNTAIQRYGIPKERFDSYTLFQLTQYNDQPLPGFTLLETKKLTGRLWEGLYKNYLLGIRKSDGSTEDAMDSVLPLILIAKDKTHLFVVTETKSGESIILRQQLDLTH